MPTLTLRCDGLRDVKNIEESVKKMLQIAEVSLGEAERTKRLFCLIAHTEIVLDWQLVGEEP